MKTILHHFTANVTPNNLELVVELFRKLDFELSYQEAGARWCMVRQGSMSIQLIETEDQPAAIEQKTSTHVGFLSDKPGEKIAELKKWLEGRNINFRQGGWSERELWFDLPDVFVNFVIEIMHTSVVSGNK